MYLRVNLQKCRENKLKAGRKESKFYSLLIAGLETAAGQWAMSRLTGELTSQLFVLPVMLIGHNQLFQLLSVCSESLCIAKR